MWAPNEDYPGIAITRSFGDQCAKKLGVSARPDIKESFLTSQDRFIMIASDGIWDMLTNKEILAMIT